MLVSTRRKTINSRKRGKRQGPQKGLWKPDHCSTRMENPAFERHLAALLCIIRDANKIESPKDSAPGGPNVAALSCSILCFFPSLFDRARRSGFRARFR